MSLLTIRQMTTFVTDIEETRKFPVLEVLILLFCDHRDVTALKLCLVLDVDSAVCFVLFVSPHLPLAIIEVHAGQDNPRAGVDCHRHTAL